MNDWQKRTAANSQERAAAWYSESRFSWDMARYAIEAQQSAAWWAERAMRLMGITDADQLYS